jgi:hypothetical protein
MNPILLISALILNTISAWNWRGSPEIKQTPSDLCNAMNKSLSFNETDSTLGICWEAMTYKRFDLENVTAVYQPGFWEKDYPEIMDFCSEKGNGTFCYRPNSQMNDSCLDMAVVRCPEGIISSCRSNFICNEVMNQNITCDASVGFIFNTSYTESGKARCQAIEHVIKLPPAQNVTTAVDQQNNTITVGSQVFGFPFATTTTVDCTFTCISTLPSGFPQPTQVMTACFNESLPYDQLIPKTTCAGPYPPGPMTSVTETQTICISTGTTPMERTSAPTEAMTSSTEHSSSMMSSSEISQCPIGSFIESSSSYETAVSAINGYSSSMTEISASPCESEAMMSSIGEPTPSPSYEYTPSPLYY